MDQPAKPEDSWGIGDAFWKATAVVNPALFFGGEVLKESPKAREVALTPVMAIGEALDSVRQGWHSLGYMLGGFSWGEAWKAADQGKSLVRMMAPKWSGRHPTAAWGLGVAFDTWSDPLNMVAFGTLTKAGRAAAKAGSLAVTWKEQARLGQRALIQFTKPFASTGLTLVKAPKALQAIAWTGNRLGRIFAAPFGWVSDPYVRNILKRVRVMAPGMEPHKRMWSIQDRMDELRTLVRKKLGKRAVHEVERTAEVVGIPQTWAREAAQRYSPEVQKYAKQLKALVDQGNQIGSSTLGIEVNLGRGVNNWWDVLRRADNEEALRLIKAHQENMKKLDKVWGSKFTQAAKLRQQAARIEEAGRKARTELFEMPMSQWNSSRAGQLAERSNRNFHEAMKLSAKAARLEAAGQLKRQAAEKTVQDFVVWSPKREQLAKAMAVAEDVKNHLPNPIPRALSPKMAEAVYRKNKGLFRGDVRHWIFSDEWFGRHNRRWAERFDKMTGEKLTWQQWHEAGRQKVLRPLTYDEINDLLKNAPPGTEAARYAEKFKYEGIFEKLERWFRGIRPKEPVERMYQMDFVTGFERQRIRLMQRLKTKQALEWAQEMPEVFIREEDFIGEVAKARRGWHHTRELHSSLGKEMPGYIHPELYREMTEGFMHAAAPDAMNIALRGLDVFTKTFKRAVTGWWPSYQWRNNVSDTILMQYDGLTNPARVLRDGGKAAFSEAFYRRGVDTMIDTGPLYGKLSGRTVRENARALGITFGEQTDAGVRGLSKKLEDMRRMGYLVENLRRGYTWQQAALQTKKVLFDYSELTRWERQYMKRIIPFWSWLRNNVRLETETLLKKPGTILAQLRLRSGREKDVPYIPAWVRGRSFIAMEPDQQTGEERLFAGLDLPIEDLCELLDFRGGARKWLRDLAWRANPALKLGIAIPLMASGRGGQALDLHRPKSAPYLRALYEKDWPHWKFLETAFGARRKVSQDGEEYFTIHPYADFVLKNLPSSRYLSTARRWGRTDTGIGAKALRFLTGYGTIKYDPEEQRRRDEEREREKAAAAAERVGDLIRGHYYIKPSGSKMTETTYQWLQGER